MKASFLIIYFLLSSFSFTQILQDEYLYETNDHRKAFKKLGIKKMITRTIDYDEDGKKEYISEIFYINKEGLIEKYEDPSWEVDYQETWLEYYFYDEEFRLVKNTLEIQGNAEVEIEETHYA